MGVAAAAFWLSSPAWAEGPQLAAAAPERDREALCMDPLLMPDLRVTACTLAIAGATDVGRRAAYHLSRAQALHALGNTARALGDYRETVALVERIGRPTSQEQLHRGIALHALGESDAALGAYDEAIRLDSRNALALVDRGILLAAREGQLERALADFDAALAIVPDNVDALLLRSDLHGRLGDDARALADVGRALLLAPGNARLLTARARVHARQGARDLALADYAAALAVDERHVDALVDRAALLSSGRPTAEDLSAALADLDAAVVLAPRHAIAVYNRGFVHFARGDLGRAKSDYSRAIDLAPAMTAAYVNRCLVRTLAGTELREALADCDEALRLSSESLDALETRGFVYLKLGEAAVAERDYEAVLRRDPDRPISLYGRGLARERRGETRAAAVDKLAARALMGDVGRAFADLERP
jgi:tetratricopeptide (TPR) repeat protein